MFAFPEMLIQAAKEAGIKVPHNAKDFEASEFPRFHIFCNIQLGVPLPHPFAPGDNAKVIAAIKDEEIHTITINDLEERGLAIGFPIP